MNRRKFFHIIVSVFFAFILWVYVVTVVSPENDLTLTGIPVVFSGQEELTTVSGMTISDPNPKTVSVRFHGSRSDLKQLQNNRSELSAVIDVSKFTEEREYTASYEITLPDSLKNKAISLTDRSPKAVQFTVSTLSTVAVPIKGVFIGTVADGYTVGEPTFELDSVIVSGTSDVISQIDYAQVSLDGDRVAGTVYYQAPISLIGTNGEQMDMENIRISEDTTEVTLPVYRIHSIPLKVNVIAGGGAAKENVEVSVTPGTIEVYGEETLLEKTTSIVVAEIDLSGIYEDYTSTEKIAPPSGTHLVDPTQTATIELRFRPGLTTENYRVQSPQYEHLAYGLDLENGSKAVTLTLRGTPEAMSDVKPDELQISIDLSECLKEGTYTVPMKVSGVPEGVGVVGTMTTDVTIVAHQASD